MSAESRPSASSEASPTISLSILPPNKSATFADSSFFSRNGTGARLPPPADVRAKSAAQDPTRVNSPRPRPVRYDNLGLIVKFGRAPDVTVGEGQCLWAMRCVLPQVPVPEIYGWTHDGDEVFLFMELVHGATLEQRWECLDRAERIGVCEQLRLLVLELRKLRHGPGEFFLGKHFLWRYSGFECLAYLRYVVGHINGEPLGDIVFADGLRPPAGPFGSATEFHDWLSAMIKRGIEHHWPGIDSADIPDPYRKGLPDDAAVVFTHADLHPSNIIVSLDSPCRIVAIIDWRQSGWYPDYWEFCKAQFTAVVNGEWMVEHLPRILEEPSCLEAWEVYPRALGY